MAYGTQRYRAPGARGVEPRSSWFECASLRPLGATAPLRGGARRERVPLIQAFACESRKSPKQVKQTITASMKYCEREAFRTLS
jgi:hypothetical protein